MKLALASLEMFEKTIDLGAGRARFIDWHQKLELHYNEAQMRFIINKLHGRALTSASKPAAFTMWATKVPLGEWMSDSDYDKLKRLRDSGRFGRGAESAESILGVVGRLPRSLLQRPAHLGKIAQ